MKFKQAQTLQRETPLLVDSNGGVQVWSWEVFRLSFLIVSSEEIDWPGLRAAAVAIGIRKAARHTARDLPPDEQERFVQRAMKRCSREKWLVKSQQDKAEAIVMSSTALCANVRKGADVLADVLATRKGETKLHLSKYALEASQEAAEHPQKLTIARQAKEIAQTASDVWA